MMLEFMELALQPNLPSWVQDTTILAIAKYLKFHRLTVTNIVSKGDKCYILTRNHKIAVTFKVTPEYWRVSNISLLS